jgi:hypothetical protein
VGFKPMIPALEQTKTAHALDCTATVPVAHHLLFNKYHWFTHTV